MITAKGLKPTSQSQQSQPAREDYAETEQSKSRIVPLAFLLFLTGCAAYLKSFLPVKIEAREAQETGKHEDADQADPRPDDEVDAVTNEDVAKHAGRNAESSDNAAPIRLARESGEVFNVGYRSIDPASPPRLGVATGPIGDPVQANDNRPAAQSNPGAGGGPSPSSGSSPNERKPPPDTRDNPSEPGGTTPGGTTPGNTPPDPARNRAPRTNGPIQLQDLAGCQILMISMATLLAGATDADGDRLVITGLSSTSGTLAQTEDGGWTFERDPGMLGQVTLTYTISDGSASIQQTAYFNVVEAPPIIGTAGDDNLLGTNCGETVDGRAGDDNIDARGGSDTVIGGDGDDHIIAGSGNDVVYAGAGDDIVFAGSGNDIVFGGSGDDHLYGDDGDDTILGEEGDDFISGGSGVDILVGGDGNDTLQGDAGNDTLDGGAGHDKLAGGVGNDVITAGDGNDGLFGGDGNDVMSDGAGYDTVDGGTGSDHLLAAVDGADDSYDGGIGQDVLDYSAATESVTVDLGSGTAEGCETGTDAIANFEEVVGGSGDDKIIAGPMSAAIKGGAGNDTLEGGAGDDTISDGTGRDTVAAGGGDDHVVAALDAASDSYDGGAGQDSLDYSTATFSITVDVGSGTADGLDIGQDLIAAFEEVIAGSGDDRLVAGSTPISMTGGDGNDTFEFQRAEEDQAAMMVRKITDFTVGDRIVAATYEITYLQEDGAEDELSDMFAALYLSEDVDNNPVRFRFEDVAGAPSTFVDVRDRPDTEDFYTIEIAGFHHLQFNIAGA